MKTLVPDFGTYHVRKGLKQYRLDDYLFPKAELLAIPSVNPKQPSNNSAIKRKSEFESDDRPRKRPIVFNPQSKN